MSHSRLYSAEDRAKSKIELSHRIQCIEGWNYERMGRKQIKQTRAKQEFRKDKTENMEEK